MTSTLKKLPILQNLEPEFISNIHMLLIYGVLGNSCLIVTKDQMVYVLGNSCECSTRSSSYNGRKRIESLCGQNIKTMACSKQSKALLLTESGKVYSLGAWECERCCSYQGSSYCPALKNIQLNVQDNFVVDIACGHYFTVALTRTGNVYIWGDDRMKKEGWMPSPTVPCKVNTGKHVPQFHSISCGANHCMAVPYNGHVYSWGSNSKGQLGLGDNLVRTEACEVADLSGIAIEKVVCGCNHTLALSYKGTLYSWGDNTYGQLGVILDSKKNSLKPIPLPRLPKVLDMAASNRADISVAMRMDHQIFMWGKASGQCITIPTKISVDSIQDAFALHVSPKDMHQPFIVDYEEKKEEGRVEKMNIMDHLIVAFDDKSTSDLTIEVEGEPIYVHKTILKIRSKYFNAMFQGDWKENNDSIVKISDFSYVAYRAFLKFLYTDEIDATIPTENVAELFPLADLCDVGNLKATIPSVLTHRISATNTALIYSLAELYNYAVLKSRCIRFAVKHMAEISESKSFSELTQETMRNFIIEVIKEGAFKS